MRYCRLLVLYEIVKQFRTICATCVYTEYDVRPTDGRGDVRTGDRIWREIRHGRVDLNHTGHAWLVSHHSAAWKWKIRPLFISSTALHTLMIMILQHFCYLFSRWMQKESEGYVEPAHERREARLHERTDGSNKWGSLWFLSLLARTTEQACDSK